ncbi:MAG: HNH endonuclease [Gammaproteobacteria bacterium]
MHSKAQTVKAVCDTLLAGDREAAAATARSDYPFVPPQSASRAYTESQCTSIFIRDGFIDRYSGTQLVFPGTIRLLSRLLASEFPFHPNWKMTETYMMYWELFPTVDHILSVARGGVDDETNWVTTSMLRNSAKSNWTLEELGWQLVLPGDFKQWDGLLGWFIEFIKQHQSHLADSYIRRWHRAALEKVHAVQPVIPAYPQTAALRLPFAGR